MLKHTLSEKKILNFDHDTLPLVDKNVSLDEVIARVDVPLDVPCDLWEKLEFWRESGYVVLEKVLPVYSLVRFVLGRGRRYRRYNRKSWKHRANGLVYQFNGQKSTQLKNIPKELLKRDWVENKWLSQHFDRRKAYYDQSLYHNFYEGRISSRGDSVSKFNVWM